MWHLLNKKMNEYRLFIAYLAKNGLDKIFLNSDEDKMRDVFIEMFKNSKDVIRIFAGQLCNNVTQGSEYIEALSDFIENGGKLRILLNNFDENKALNSNLFKRLAFYKSRNYNLEIKKTTDKPVMEFKATTVEENKTVSENKSQDIEVHFAIGDTESYRIETDIKQRRAICNMHGSSKAEELAKFFDELYSQPYTQTVNLISLFNIQIHGVE